MMMLGTSRHMELVDAANRFEVICTFLWIRHYNMIIMCMCRICIQMHTRMVTPTHAHAHTQACMCASTHTHTHAN